MPDQKNLIIAIALSFAILIGFQFFYEVPRMEAERARQEAIQQSQQEAIANGEAPSDVPRPAAGTAPAAPGASLTIGTDLTREQALSLNPRVTVDTPTIRGSISLKGARLDDVILKNYQETVDPSSPDPVSRSDRDAPTVLCGVRVGWCRRRRCRSAQRRVRLDRERRCADPGPTADPDLGQWPRPDLRAADHRR